MRRSRQAEPRRDDTQMGEAQRPRRGGASITARRCRPAATRGRRRDPTMESIGIGPRYRLSAEFDRLSPSTYTWPSGTVCRSIVGVLAVGGIAGLGASAQVRLVERLVVDVDDAVAGLDDIAGQADHALDEVLDAVGADLARVELEHDDVAAVDVVEVVAELVHQHPVALLQGGLHRPGRDVEGLEEEGLHHQRHDQRTDDHRHPLDRGPDREPASGRQRRCSGAPDRCRR